MAGTGSQARDTDTGSLLRVQAFVRQQEENCKKLQQAFLDIPEEGDTMSNVERQQFFQSLARNSIH